MHHVCLLKEDKEMSSTVALFVGYKDSAKKVISYSIMFLFISTMHPFDNDARDKYVKSERQEMKYAKGDFR